jgi:hypothetical protein
MSMIINDREDARADGLEWRSAAAVRGAKQAVFRQDFLSWGHKAYETNNLHNEHEYW